MEDLLQEQLLQEETSLKEKHNLAIRSILEKEGVQKLVAYSQVPIPEKRLHARQAAAFTSAARRIAEDFLSKPREKTLLDFLLLPRILGIAFEQGKIVPTLNAYPRVCPSIPSSFTQEKPDLSSSS